MLGFLKDCDKNSFYEFYLKSEMGEFIRTIAPYINKRSYFKIENNGKIIKKNFNYALPLLAAITKDNEKEIVHYIYDNCLDYSETMKIEKIDRLSNFTVEKLKTNLFKIFFNRERAFALRYCKELYLRDKEEFYSSIYRYGLMNDITSRKLLLIQAFEKLSTQIKNKKDVDYLLFCVVDYIVNYESNLYKYQYSKEVFNEHFGSINCEDVYSKIYFKAILELGKYSEEDTSKFKNILFNNVDNNIKTNEDLGYDLQAEKIILNYMNKGE